MQVERERAGDLSAVPPAAVAAAAGKVHCYHGRRKQVRGDEAKKKQKFSSSPRDLSRRRKKSAESKA